MSTCSVLGIDFETRSRVDLLKCGAYKYAASDTTDILCLAWAFDDEPVEVWVPGQPFPDRVRQHLEAGARRSISAANAQFERLITRHVLPRYVDFRQPPMDAFYCSLAQARARALPGNLDDLARCLGTSVQKDKRGRELIKLLCIPDPATGEFREDADLMEEMIAYNRRDVEVERAVSKMTPPLTDTEFQDFVVNEMVNDAGLLVDVDFAHAAVQYADAEMDEIRAKLAEVTDGRITSPKQFASLKLMMLPLMEVDDRIRKAMTRVETDRREGTEKRRIVLDKDARSKLLAMAESEPGFLPEDVIEVLELTDAAGKSSVSKFGNMELRAGDDGRVRGAFIFSGAGQTGRASSTGAQLHNFPRVCAKQPDELRAKVMAGDTLDNVMADLSSMLRPAIMAAPGNILVVGDWSAIEARILPWLSGDLGGEQVLEIFRTNDADPSLPDIYKVEYASAYSINANEVTKEQRQVGKVLTLSYGYQGGVKAAQAMARGYKVKLDDAEAARLRDDWRSRNQWAPLLWKASEAAIKDAMTYVGQQFVAGRMTYCRPTHDAPLYCLLPSGRVLSYPQPVMEYIDGPYGTETKISAIKAQWKPKQGESDWGRIQLYGGQICENACQATAADVLREGLRKLVEDGWTPIGHVHDEIILEVREAEEADAKIELTAVMLEVPEWAPGLPLACEVSSGRRYSK